MGYWVSTHKSTIPQYLLKPIFNHMYVISIAHTFSHINYWPVQQTLYPVLKAWHASYTRVFTHVLASNTKIIFAKNGTYEYYTANFRGCLDC